jgi:hypothetical protein
MTDSPTQTNDLSKRSGDPSGALKSPTHLKDLQ